MSDTGEEADGRAEPSKDQRLNELSQNPHPAASRAAIAARYPTWGLATMALLVVGLVVGYLSLLPHGVRLSHCGPAAHQLACTPSTHPLVVVLPVAGLVLGLAVSILGGRLIAKRDRSPVPAAVAGWVIFVAAAVAGAVITALR